MEIMIIKGVHNVKRGPLPDKKVFSLISSHHKRKETERIVQGSEILFFSSVKKSIRIIHLSFVRIIGFKIVLVSYNC